MNSESQLTNRINLNIGEVIVSKQKKDVIWTVLGSCICVIFHVPNTLSVLCHAQMPSRGNFECECFSSCPQPCYNNLSEANDYKYVACALKYMFKILKESKVNITNISVSLIGGATVLGKINRQSIGDKNIEIAKEILNSYGIKINKEMTGGNSGYTLWYYTNENKLIVSRHNEKEKIEL